MFTRNTIRSFGKKTKEQRDDDLERNFGKKNREMHNYAPSAPKYKWATSLEYMQFVFRDAASAGTSEEVSEVDLQFEASETDARYVRYKDTRPGGLFNVYKTLKSPLSGRQSSDVLFMKFYHKAEATRHMLLCLEQGEINAEFDRLEKEADSDDDDLVEFEKKVKWIVGVGAQIGEGEGFISPPINPKEGDSPLHTFLSCLKPDLPTEAFNFFGIGIRCISDKQYIPKVEGCSISIKDASVRPDAITALTFLQEVTESQPDYQQKLKKNEHFLDIILDGIRKYKKMNPEEYEERVVTFKRVNRATRSLFKFLEKVEYIDEDESVSHKLEYHLNAFINSVLSLNGTIYGMFNTLHMQPFKMKNAKTVPKCIPDILYECEPSELTKDTIKKWEQPIIPIGIKIKECEAARIHMEIVESPMVKIVKVLPGLVWQIFEQLFAVMLLYCREDAKAGHIIFQGGLLVVNGKVRSVVMCITAEKYNQIKKCQDIQETLRFIQTCEGDWCTLYIEKTEYMLWDIISQAEFLTSNFCGVTIERSLEA